MQIATLCYILKNGRLLLKKKANGLFGGGKWNGVGGKCRVDEHLDACVRREVYEETGLTVTGLRYHGVLLFSFGLRDVVDWQVHVYSTSTFRGKIRPSAEGALRWFPVDAIPYDGMWVDDRYWLPLVLKDIQFRGRFVFTVDGTRILDCNVTTVSTANNGMPR